MITSLTVILLSPLTNSSGSLKDPLERSSCRLWPRKQPQNNRNSPRHSKLKWLHKSLPSEEALPNKQGKGQQIPGRTEDRCAQYFISSATSKNIGTAPPRTISAIATSRRPTSPNSIEQKLHYCISFIPYPTALVGLITILQIIFSCTWLKVLNLAKLWNCY